MAKANFVEFNSGKNLTRGYLVLLCGDSADKTAVGSMDNYAIVEIRVRKLCQDSKWEYRSVVPSNKDVENHIDAFLSKSDASIVARQITAKAEEIRFSK